MNQNQQLRIIFHRNSSVFQIYCVYLRAKINYNYKLKIGGDKL